MQAVSNYLPAGVCLCHATDADVEFAMSQVFVQIVDADGMPVNGPLHGDAQTFTEIAELGLAYEIVPAPIGSV
jgi:hypothetical protein